MEKVAFASAMMTTPFFALFGWTWFYLSALMGLFTIMNYYSGLAELLPISYTYSFTRFE
jgi:hypothetical protein